MATSAIANIGVKIIFNDKVFECYEGDKITNLVYTEGPVTKSISGSIRVISVSTRAYSSGPDECPPESFISDICQVNELIIDSSSEFDADIIHVPIKNIVSIEKVNDKDPVAGDFEPNLRTLFVYDKASWEAAKKEGVPEDWMPAYNPDVEKHPWIVIIVQKGNAKVPTKLSSLIIQNNGENVAYKLNASSSVFDNGVWTLSKESHYLGLELIVPEQTENKDYLEQSKIKTNDSYNVFAVLNNEITISASGVKYMGPTL